jgi:NADH-quinone oxidoreductase subunit H
MLAVISLDIVGIWMAGWGSFSKYPLLGAMRSVGQLLSYEVPLGLAVLCVVIWAGSVDLAVIGLQQGIQTTPLYLFGSETLGLDVSTIGGFLTWNICQVPWFLPLYFIFYLATLAECNRAPFDLPEAEAELVGGFHTEYSGFGFSLFFLAEYALMVLVSVAGVFLFLGGWNTPLPNLGPIALADWTGAGNPLWALFWLFGKTLALLVSHVWLRWTLPRLRIDQLMHLGWKVLTPAALLMVLATLAWRVF